MNCGVNDNSLEHIHTSELYPRKPLQCDDDDLYVPFPELPGENVEYLGRTTTGTIALSNFRLFICYAESFVNIPLGLIDNLEQRDIFYIYINCKDSRLVRCTFATNEACLRWYKRLIACLQPPRKLYEVFAFAYKACCDKNGRENGHPSPIRTTGRSDCFGASFDSEVERLGFDLKQYWRISHVNEDYSVCRSYPKLHIVPKSVTDENIEKAASFRACRRFPSIVWRDVNSGAVLARCSQPEVGWLGWRNEEDECLLQSILTTCIRETAETGDNRRTNQTGESEEDEERRLLVVDARSYTAAVANRAKGGGCECPEYYPNCDIEFMSLANIHSIRKSFVAVRSLCAQPSDQPGWLSSIENTKWLQHISGLLRTATLVVNAISSKHQPVLVHCSDGWDRTPQIVALAELLLDPFYRTIQGFSVLVEKEWLSFGHKFGDRCGHGICSQDSNERCPVFLQWLDCVYQVLNQYPCAFQFTQTYLVKLAHHVYTCLFGTFLCNSNYDREQAQVRQQTHSVWSLLHPSNNDCTNLLYDRESYQILRPSYFLQNLKFWEGLYLSESLQKNVFDRLIGPEINGECRSTSGSGFSKYTMSKTESCDVICERDTASLDKQRVRRASDSSITPIMAGKPAELDRCYKIHSLPAEVCPNGVQTEPSHDNNAYCSCNGAVDEEENNEEGTPPPEPDHLSKSCPPMKPQKPDVSNDDPEPGINTSHADSRSNGEISSVNGSTETLTNEEIPTEVDHIYQERGKTYQTAEADSVICQEACEIDNNPTDKLNLVDNDDTVAKDETPCSLHTANPEEEQQPEPEVGSVDVWNGEAHRDLNQVTADESIVKGEVVPLNHVCEPITDQLLNDEGKASDSNDDEQSTSEHNEDGRRNSAEIVEEHKDQWLKQIEQLLDCDGLTRVQDPTHHRLIDIQTDYLQQMRCMEAKLNHLKMLLYRANLSNNGTNKALAEAQDEKLSLDSGDSGEQGSLGGGSNATSDHSWEQVDEKDAHMTLWVPDHAVTHCAGCDRQFWTACRKHHCRSCGQVFCGECSNYSIPIPQQYLNNPVRVCRACFRSNQERFLGGS